MVILAATFGVMFGIIIKESYDEKEIPTLGDSILYMIFTIIIGFIVTSVISLVLSCTVPKIDYDYSFKIYNVNPTGTHEFYLDQKDNCYTYMRKDGNGTRMESIPTDITSIVYSDNEPAGVFVDAHKHFYNRDWNEKYNIYWFIPSDDVCVDKYIMTVPTDTVIRG